MRTPYWVSLETNKEWENYIKALLRRSDRAVNRAVLVIDGFQTDEEARSGYSLEDNKMGWSKNDAPVMSKIAIELRRCKSLGQKDQAIARFRIQKYWKQLSKIGREKALRYEDLWSKNDDCRILCEEQQVREFTKQMEKIEQLVMKEFDEKSCRDCDYGICSECQNSGQSKITS